MTGKTFRHYEEQRHEVIHMPGSKGMMDCHARSGLAMTVFKNRTTAILVAKVIKGTGFYQSKCFHLLDINRMFKNRTTAILVAKVT